MKKSISEELFIDLYNKMSKKIEESSETIFTGVDISSHANTNYERFMESNYTRDFYIAESTYEKNKVIKLFIEKEVLSDLYTSTYDHLIHESSDSQLSFKEIFLLENTQEQFKCKYKGSSNHELEQFEEGFGGAFLTAGVGAAFGLVPAIAFGAITFLGMNLLFPAAWSKFADDKIEYAFGHLGKALFGTKSLFAMGNTSLAASNKNIINFDNIDVNPEVKALFHKLSRTSDKNAPIDGINTIVSNCVEKNDALNAMDIDESDKNWLRGKYTPQKNTIFTVFIESLFKKSAGKKDDEFDTLIRYRKCLSEKLVDMYKFLMIANISQNKSYKEIIRSMKRGFHENPEQLLAFIHDETSEEQMNKENIITLMKFRLFLEDMAKSLKQGTFDVDRESSIYLTQKLKTVDTEIESEIQKHDRQLATSFETRDEFDRKDFKYNPRPDRNFKRNLFGLADKVK